MDFSFPFNAVLSNSKIHRCANMNEDFWVRSLFIFALCVFWWFLEQLCHESCHLIIQRWKFISGDVKLIKQLISQNVELNVPDRNGRTPIFTACKEGIIIMIWHCLASKPLISKFVFVNHRLFENCWIVG